MKKFVCIVSLLLFLHQVARTQVLIALLFGEKLNTGSLEFGITVGPSLTNITGAGGKSKAGLNLGLYFNIRLHERWYIHPEGVAKGGFGARDILPYSVGNDSLDKFFAGGSVKRKIGTLSMPVLIEYKIHKRWFAEIGPQVNLLTKSNDIFTNTVNDNELTNTVDIRDHITRFDFGMAAGLVYKLRENHGMGLCLRYYGGFTDIQKDLPGTNRNSMWQFNVTIPIGAGKARAQTTPPPNP